MAKKIKSYDIESMQREKLKLMRECAEYEQKLLGHFDTLRKNPMRMAVTSILPFEEGVKSGVMHGLDLLNETIFPVVLGATFKKGKDHWSKNLMQVGQAIIIAYSFKFFKRIFGKKKKSQDKTVDSSPSEN